jgi:hypothetical protein
VSGDYLIAQTWLQDIQSKVNKLAGGFALSIWDQEDQSRPKASIVDLKLRDLVAEKCRLDKAVTDSVWAAQQGQVGKQALSVYETKLEEQDIACDEQFTSLWTTRVVVKAQLYSAGIEEIHDENLRNQLSELLKSHLASELVPQASSRAKSKGFLKSPRKKLSSRLAKLQTALPGKNDYAAMMEELEKFNSKINLSSPSSAQLKEEKSKLLQDMAKAMNKDQDSARLFLGLLIIIFGANHNGILYATGKFAPKILKMLKQQQSDEDTAWLDQVKDSIKAGTTTDEMKNKMRAMATDKTRLALM